MTAVKKDIYIEQGATFILAFQWVNQGPVVGGVVTPGTPKNLTGWVVRMQVRKSQQDTAQIDANTTNAKIILGRDPSTENPTTGAFPAADPTNGWIYVNLTPTDTNMLTTKAAKYDLEAENPAGKVYRLLQGAVTIDPNITQATSEPVLT